VYRQWFVGVNHAAPGTPEGGIPDPVVSSASYSETQPAVRQRVTPAVRWSGLPLEQ
jgi:hypothetical protein